MKYLAQDFASLFLSPPVFPHSLIRHLKDEDDSRFFFNAIPHVYFTRGLHIMLDTVVAASNQTTYPTKSGIGVWIDPDTPVDRYVYTSSRGRPWDLVMSDEFNVPNRSFRAGDDHMWTSIEKPDGVNGALELYSHNLTSTRCDADGTCYFYIKTIDEPNSIRVYNMYTHPPSYQTVHFWYRGAMVQSWNKFCYQGGMLEVRAQLPGATSPASGNPDLALGPHGKTANTQFYPTWPGIWMLGNLARAIFSASTNRMWPFSYNECNPDVFNTSFQRISACESEPGYGLNPYQGRGAPEIDVLEGAGLYVSASVQIGPGMPLEYRLFPVDESTGDFSYCLYTYACKTLGANNIDVPTAYYRKQRGHKSWYQGLRYASNNFCTPDPKFKQTYATVAASLKRGVTRNACTPATCPGSGDVNADLSVMDDGKKGNERWGINTNGTCFSLLNSYFGSYLCDPDNTYFQCPGARNASTAPSGATTSFHYQMDAISSNWPLHVGAYTDYYEYQVEWVTGRSGYVRWMLHGEPLFEITSETIETPPQSAQRNNPTKMMIEEPLYIIMNVALSRSWGTTPPHPGQACRGDGTDQEANAICDAFPMYMKVDYVRLYQDRGAERDADNYMHVGCDPASHPTKEWIQAHLEEYEDDDNAVVDVHGKAFCTTNDDCTIGGILGTTTLRTGKCVQQRCECLYQSWGGPRCTSAIAGSSSTDEGVMSRTYGPPVEAAITLAILACVLSAGSAYVSMTKSAKQTKIAIAQVDAERKAAAHAAAADAGSASAV
ncbi:hypothetical protein PsorP6_009754 [Peronosclerospora sorghi]|uniref:Uncharacterized protein n=1 Tax=Peronosclerospora sorghi TaxID=230839 RepID=A0ACC0W249_9STRA|nr:hypothetical protein PsorP6_009754 [Peronosclerospora sorghi]